MMYQKISKPQSKQSLFEVSERYMGGGFGVDSQIYGVDEVVKIEEFDSMHNSKQVKEKLDKASPRKRKSISVWGAVDEETKENAYCQKSPELKKVSKSMGKEAAVHKISMSKIRLSTSNSQMKIGLDNVVNVQKSINASQASLAPQKLV